MKLSRLAAALVLLAAEASPGAPWSSLESGDGITELSNEKAVVMAVACGSQPRIALSPAAGGQLPSYLLQEVRVDSNVIQSGYGNSLAHEFELENGRLILDDPPIGFIRLLKEGLELQMSFHDHRASFDLRGFTSSFNSVCGDPGGPSKESVGSGSWSALSSPAPSGWRIRFTHDCRRGRFVFSPTESRAKWDTDRKKLVDETELPLVNPMKIVYDGDMDGAARYPYSNGWYQAFKRGDRLRLTITDYSAVGGPRKSSVSIDLQGFCGE